MFGDGQLQISMGKKLNNTRSCQPLVTDLLKCLRILFPCVIFYVLSSPDEPSSTSIILALAQDLERVPCNLATYFNVIPKENQASYNRARRYLDEMQSCLRFHSIMAPYTPLPAENTPVPSASTRSYRDAARKAMPHETPQPLTPAQVQRSTQTRAIRQQTQAVKAQIR